jgi:serine/threonine protein kinase
VRFPVNCHDVDDRCLAVPSCASPVSPAAVGLLAGAAVAGYGSRRRRGALDAAAAAGEGCFMADTLGLPGFEVLEIVGRGGFGVVYKARQVDFDRLVAVKVLIGEFDERARSRFDRERKALGALSSHPNIVQVYASGRMDDGNPYLVMEFATGGSLADRMTREGPVPWREAGGVGVKIAVALSAAHERGVLHRDVKPENVLFATFGEPMLADFGIAQVVGQTATGTGIITASVQHAAPEVLNGLRPTEASDQYALASTIHAAIAGRAPFVRDTDESLIPMIARISTEAPPDLRAQGVPDGVCAALERALAKDPKDRYQTVDELRMELELVSALPKVARLKPEPEQNGV